MTISVFEGARRIAILVGTLWAIAVVAYFWENMPRVSITYSVNWPDETPMRVTGGEPWKRYCGSHDAEETQYRSTAKGTQVTVTICFRAQKTDDGRLRVPYRMDRDKKGSPTLSWDEALDAVSANRMDRDEKGSPGPRFKGIPLPRWWGGESYSSEVSDYKRRVGNNFNLSRADEEWADNQYWPERWKHIGYAAAWLVGGWVALLLLTFIVGWIVRGFLGIPRGQDQ